MTLEEQAKLIFADYKIHSRKASLPRTGFYLVGIHDENKWTAANRPDSVEEHSAGLLHLVFSVAMYCPDLIPERFLLRAVKLALYHDAPETESGDTPDDGRRNDNEKDAIEYATLQQITKPWPELLRLELRSDYLNFQAHDAIWTQALYCLDKIEAVLRALEYERRNHGGSMSNKHPMSDQDAYYCELIHSMSVADIWGCHALDRIKNCAGADLARAILIEAFADVRGTAPDWLTKTPPHNDF